LKKIFKLFHKPEKNMKSEKGGKIRKPRNSKNNSTEKIA